MVGRLRDMTTVLESAFTFSSGGLAPFPEISQRVDSHCETAQNSSKTGPALSLSLSLSLCVCFCRQRELRNPPKQRHHKRSLGLRSRSEELGFRWSVPSKSGTVGAPQNPKALRP